MARSGKVKLGERDYEVSALTIRQAREWREKFAGPFERIIKALKEAPVMQLDDTKAVVEFIGVISGSLLTSTDAFMDMLLAYSPALRADEEYILDNATDEEAMAAFAEVLKLAYPFGGLMKVIRGPAAR
jgi:hypothetical protein